jgi:DNA repair exonuclease SbcCD ATPase subunit
VTSLTHVHEKEATLLKQQERSLKILDDVPCEDKYPGCKFIKDAHLAKSKVPSQREVVKQSLESLKKASSSLEVLKSEGLRDRIEKLQKLQEAQSQFNVELANEKMNLARQQESLEKLCLLLDDANNKLVDMEKALKNNENSEVVFLRTKIEELSRASKSLDEQKMKVAGDKGRLLSDLQRLAEDQRKREELCVGMESTEMIASAFSKKGIPSDIVASQLPLINDEIAKVLAGIVDFTVELQVDPDSDWMDVYINYGDSRRIIELASGMEKMISSIAIRVALINVSTLPKTDMLIIDEGFGALDDSGVEACNRLLTSLKRYFRTIVVITHVDGVKDIADYVIEISKSEKDSKVLHDS